MIKTNNICPLCQAQNNCMAYSETPCWCNNIKVPQELIDLVADELKGKTCICLACIQAFNLKKK